MRGSPSSKRARTPRPLNAASEFVVARPARHSPPAPLSRPKSRDAAKRAVKAIRQGVKLLGKNPNIGRPVEELPPEFREWVIEFGNSAYVALYRYDGSEVVILAVRHGREAG